MVQFWVNTLLIKYSCKYSALVSVCWSFCSTNSLDQSHEHNKENLKFSALPKAEGLNRGGVLICKKNVGRKFFVTVI